jgi:hypothetical protein
MWHRYNAALSLPFLPTIGLGRIKKSLDFGNYCNRWRYIIQITILHRGREGCEYKYWGIWRINGYQYQGGESYNIYQVKR